MFPSSYHHEIFRSYYHGQKWCPCKRSRSEVKGQGHRGQHPTTQVDFCKTTYLSSEELGHYLLEHKNELTILSLNIQSIRSKFDQLLVILSELYERRLAFSVICLQESWLNEHDDTSPFLIPGYSLIHQGKICNQHGGLMTYVNDRFSYRIKRLYKK